MNIHFKTRFANSSRQEYDRFLNVMLMYGILPVGNQKVYAGSHVNFTANAVVWADGKNKLNAVLDITGKVTG